MSLNKLRDTSSAKDVSDWFNRVSRDLMRDSVLALDKMATPQDDRRRAAIMAYIIIASEAIRAAEREMDLAVCDAVDDNTKVAKEMLD